VHRRLPWLLAVPLMAAGPTAAHTASYVIAPVHQTEAGAEAAERAADGLSARTTLVFGLVAAAAAVGAGSRAAAKFGHRRRPGMSPWWFFALPPAAFTCQELAERLLHVESSPFLPGSSPGCCWAAPRAWSWLWATGRGRPARRAGGAAACATNIAAVASSQLKQSGTTRMWSQGMTFAPSPCSPIFHFLPGLVSLPAPKPPRSSAKQAARTPASTPVRGAQDRPQRPLIR
jgi:hypothetical protein